jgi:hypothetical protein
VTTHRSWLDLAASEPAFPLDAGERVELDAHLATCASCSAAAADLGGDSRRIAELAFAVPSRLRSQVVHGALLRPARGGAARLALVLVVLIAATLAISAGIATIGGPNGRFQFAVPGLKAIDWTTETTTLRADSIRIEANGRVFSPPPGIEVGGDAGTLESWTLETSWHQHGQEQRLYIYFAANASDWWVSEIRTYDGADAVSGEWAVNPTIPDIGAHLGVPWTGDLDITSEGRDGAVRVRIDGLTVSVTPQISYAAPPGGGRKLPENSDAFAPGGPLADSGILSLTPKAAHERLLALGYRVSWRFLVSNYSHRCLEPPPGVIEAGSGGPVGTSGEIILFVIPMGGADAKPPIPEGCV